jgi:hypothetical protein
VTIYFFNARLDKTTKVPNSVSDVTYILSKYEKDDKVVRQLETMNEIKCKYVTVKTR